MYTLTNNGRRVIITCLFLMFLLGPPAYSQEDLPEYVVDVVDDYFICEDYYFLLEDVITPIAVGVMDGVVQIEVRTSEGIEELDLGEGHLSLTERAAPYVRILEEAEDLAQLNLDQYGVCSICGRTTGLGFHQIMPCGHYGCLMSVDHLKICPSCNAYVCNGKSHKICESCKVRMCVHIDIECEYTRNPAPTAYTTVVPGEGVKTFSISEDRTSVDGAVGARPQNWAPGSDYISTKIDPDDIPAPEPNIRTTVGPSPTPSLPSSEGF